MYNNVESNILIFDPAKTSRQFFIIFMNYIVYFVYFFARISMTFWGIILTTNTECSRELNIFYGLTVAHVLDYTFPR